MSDYGRRQPPSANLDAATQPESFLYFEKQSRSLADLITELNNFIAQAPRLTTNSRPISLEKKQIWEQQQKQQMLAALDKISTSIEQIATATRATAKLRGVTIEQSATLDLDREEINRLFPSVDESLREPGDYVPFSFFLEFLSEIKNLVQELKHNYIDDFIRSVKDPNNSSPPPEALDNFYHFYIRKLELILAALATYKGTILSAE